MSYIDFLLEYYVWIIVVIIIIVVGVIGYLIDSNQKKSNKQKKEEIKENNEEQNLNEQVMNNQSTMNVEPSIMPTMEMNQPVQTEESPIPTMMPTNNDAANMMNNQPAIDVQNNQLNQTVVTTNGAEPFDINSMFANNK